MPELMPTVDYNAIREVKDLPVSWMSTHGRDIYVAGDYQKDCKARGEKSDPAKVAELIGGEIAHLRQTTLENGLRYVTIHLENGEQIFDEHEYGGLFSCGCGAIHDSPAVTMASSIRGTDLGNGIKLKMTVSGYSNGYGRTMSFAGKKFEVDGKEVEVHYSIEPESVHEAGHLNFSYEINTPSFVSYQVKNMSEGGKIEIVTAPITAKHEKVHIHTAYTSETDNKNHPYCKSSIVVVHNLPNSSYEVRRDQMEFKFDLDGRLEEIVGISEGINPNPEWNDEQVQAAIKKGQNDWFVYDAESPEAKLLSQAMFGQDVTQLQHNTRATLQTLMKSIISEFDIDLARTLRFL